jgi:hypothetical protein
MKIQARSLNGIPAIMSDLCEQMMRRQGPGVPGQNGLGKDAGA